MKKFPSAKALIIVAPLLLMVSSTHAQDSECRFNADAIDPTVWETRLKSNDLKSLKLDRKNQSIVADTARGERVSIDYYSCDSLGVEAELRIWSKGKFTREFVEKKLLWLAGILFDEPDVEKIRLGVDKSGFGSAFINGYYNGNDVAGDVVGAGYLNIEYVISEEEGALVLTITSYMD